MINLSDLNERFAIDGVLAFGATGSGLRYAEIHSSTADAKLYLQGAQLASWQPHGLRPVLYLSPRAEFTAGKPIRGGIPVVFPWFGPRAGEPSPPHTDEPGAAHGFARTQEWEPVFAAVTGEDLHLTLVLAPSQESRRYGFDHFRVALRLRIGCRLSIELGVMNLEDAPGPLDFEEALHSYFQVADATQIWCTGLPRRSIWTSATTASVKCSQTLR